jgi:hypothetical protein
LAAKSWDLEKLTLGVEFYGGVGDADLGLTLDPNKTEQYAGVNLESEFDNHFHVTIGGAFGLTNPAKTLFCVSVRGTSSNEIEALGLEVRVPGMVELA